MGVLGIGGLFFRAQDTDSIAKWYREHLNVGASCAAESAGEPDEMCWMTQSGPVVFPPFSSDTDYFSRDKAFMLNLRVSDLAQLIYRLTGAGISVETRDEWNDPNIGRFTRIHDPEGNPIELWEPPTESASTRT